MEGFGGTTTWRGVRSPLRPLLDHSDCEGTLGPSSCAKVAPELRRIVKTWNVHDYDRQMGLLLADMMDMAAKRGKKLEFT